MKKEPIAAMTFNLVLLRHGESTWNLENRFTGWTDVGLTPRGVEEARSAGRLLKAEGCDFDSTQTSLLTRGRSSRSSSRSRSSTACGCPSSAPGG